MKHEPTHSMKPLQPFFLALAISLLTVGCGVNRLLLADFDNYPGSPGDELLIGPIPGIPDDDRIHEVIPSVAVTESGPISGKSLRVSGRSDIRTAPHQTPDRYVIDWEGVRPDHESGSSTIRFLDQDGDEALVLRVDHSQIRQLTGDDPEPPPFTLAADTSHFLTVEINMGGVGSLGVTFEQGGSTTPHLNLEFRDPDFDELQTIRFDGGETSATYFVDDLNVFGIND